LCVSCSDIVIPPNVRHIPIVAVQEGILDPTTWLAACVQRHPRVFPRWLAGTAATGLSGAYARFCVASDGYREHFAALGAPRDKLIVTGIPNFDDCERYRQNTFPHRDYVLVCTSDARETFKSDDRKRFIQNAVRIAAGRELLFKLHPNERGERARREILRWAPGAHILSAGSAEEMVANAQVVITQFSSLAFVALALGKQTHSYFPLAELRRLLPEQNRCAARNIAAVCRELLEGSARTPAGRRLESPGSRQEARPAA
jgi:hypothetical protein